MTRGTQIRGGGDVAGFTLVELLNVIIIIGLLAAILLPMVTRGYCRGFSAPSMTRIKDLSDGCQMYKRDWGFFPGQKKQNTGAGVVFPLLGDGGSYTGSQVLACSVYNYTYTDISLDVPTNKPRSGYASYKDEFLQTEKNQKKTLTDGFPLGKEMALLYYPSHVGLQGIDQFKWQDNQPYTVRTIAPLDEGNAFDALITDNRLGVTSPARAYNDKEFLLIAPGVDRMYFTSDDIKNWN